MEIKTAEYHVWEDESTCTIYLEGTMRLSGTAAYEPIRKLMDDRLATKPASLTIDLTNLSFLNSSGINLLAKFTINVRKAASTTLAVKGNKAIPWQAKSLLNLSKLFPALKLDVG